MANRKPKSDAERFRDYLRSLGFRLTLEQIEKLLFLLQEIGMILDPVSAPRR